MAEVEVLFTIPTTFHVDHLPMRWREVLLGFWQLRGCHAAKSSWNAQGLSLLAQENVTPETKVESEGSSIRDWLEPTSILGCGRLTGMVNCIKTAL